MEPKRRRRFARKIHDFVAHELRVPVPPGHTLRVTVELEFRQKSHSTQVLLVDKLSGKLVPSSEPFTNEHFADVLELPLSPKDRRLVEFYRHEKNKPHSTTELEKLGFSTTSIYSVNKACNGQGLWLAIRPVRDQLMSIGKKYKFVVLTTKTESSFVNDYVGPHG